MNIGEAMSKCDIWVEGEPGSMGPLMNNFRDFTKTLPSELMDKDFSELLPDGLDNIDNSDSEDSYSEEYIL